ncbi:unnamed protein product [Diamesa serratosioi]
MTIAVVSAKSNRSSVHTQIHRFTKVECSNSVNKTFVKGYCFVKAYSRNYASLNFGGLLIRTLTKLYVELTTYYRYGTVYKQIIRTPRVEWCSFMDGNDQNIMMRMVVDLIRDSAPALLKKCPYSGDYKISNLTFNTDRFQSIFPSGNYKMELWMYDDIDDHISKILFNTNVKSVLIESF